MSPAPAAERTPAAPAMPAVRFDDVGFAWRGQPRLLDIGELTIARGERVFVQGASGSGKSTLLGLIGGVLLPQAGRVEVLGTDLAALGASRRDRFRADHVGFVFQQFNLLPYLSARDNVLLACRFSLPRRRAAQVAGGAAAAADRLLAALGLEPSRFAGRPAAELSVGQQQRVAVARALIGDPELLVADEPTSALDADARAAFLELLFRECARARTTVVFVSHDPGLATLFDRTVRLAEINRAQRANMD